MLGLMLASCTGPFLRLVKAVLLMTFFHVLTQSDNAYKLGSGIAVPQGVIPQKYITESQFLSQKSLQTQVTEVREKWEKTDKTKRDLRFLSRSTIPKISLSFPSPYPSYFQHNLDKKKNTHVLTTREQISVPSCSYQLNLRCAKNEEFGHFIS